MIGPKRPGATVYSIADWGSTTPTLPGYKVVNLDDGSTVIAHTTSGISHLTDGGYRAKFVLPLAGSYAIEWDDNGGTVFYDEEVWIEDVVLVQGGSVLGPGAVLPPYTATNPLRMKRYDTKPDLELQLLQSDGSPYPLQSGDEVWFTVQPDEAESGGFATTPLIHKQMSVDDSINGLVSYLWTPTDLSFYGAFLIELEVNTASGDVISFPGATATPLYIPFRIEADEDPGIND